MATFDVLVELDSAVIWRAEILILLFKRNSQSVLLPFQHLTHFLCTLSELFLKFTNQLVIFAFSVGEVVVGQLSVLLLELALDFIPGALELEFVHINCSGLGGTVGCN